MMSRGLSGVYEYPNHPNLAVNEMMWVVKTLVTDPSFPWLLFDVTFNAVCYQIVMQLMTINKHYDFAHFNLLGDNTTNPIDGWYVLRLTPKAEK